MIIKVMLVLTYPLIAVWAFYTLCRLDREKNILSRSGPDKCFLLAAFWPVTLLYGLLLTIYFRIVDGE